MEDVDLDIDEGPAAERPGTALERVRAVSFALSDAARRSRLSSRRASAFSSGGFEGRRGARAMRIAVLASFALIVAAPTLAAAVYYKLIASDQYVAQAEFTVSAGESPLRDGISSLTGLPGLAILQDTQIVTNYIHSRAAVERLDERIGLRSLYGDDKADWLSRFDPKRPIESFVKYWSKVSSASIKMPGGIVDLSVRAFTPEDAKRIADEALASCEDLVNGLNARINHDAVALAQEQMQRASARMSKALGALEVARNASGILETSLSASAITGLVSEQREIYLSLQEQYESALKSVSADAPQTREMKVRLDVLGRQIADLQSQLTTTSNASATIDGKPGGQTVSAAMTQFGELDVERKVAENLYTLAAAGVEHARLAAENKMIYFKVFEHPTVPQRAEYPSRNLNIFLVFIASLVAWGISAAIGGVIRNNMA